MASSLPSGRTIELTADDTEPADTVNSADVYLSRVVPGAQDVVDAGGSVSSGDVAAPAHPVIAAVTSPNGGQVTITESAPGTPPLGYTFLGRQLDISAPAASAANPLTIEFTIDAATLAAAEPDLTAATVAILRDGVPVAECTTSTLDAPATPDPCVSARVTLSGPGSDGDAKITVLTSHASAWNVGPPPAFSVPDAPTSVAATKGDRKRASRGRRPRTTATARSPATPSPPHLAARPHRSAAA